MTLTSGVRPPCRTPYIRVTKIGKKGSPHLLETAGSLTLFPFRSLWWGSTVAEELRRDVRFPPPPSRRTTPAGSQCAAAQAHYLHPSDLDHRGAVVPLKYGRWPRRVITVEASFPRSHPAQPLTIVIDNFQILSKDSPVCCGAMCRLVALLSCRNLRSIK